MITPTTKLASLPEMFYDLLAYTTPSAIFLSFLVLINEINITPILKPLKELDSFIFETLVAFLMFGALYFIGQICTTVSYYWVANPSIKLSKRLKNHSNANDIFISSVLKIKITASPEVGAEIMKRYARWVLSRNMVIFSGILLLNSIIKSCPLYIYIMVTVFILSIWDSWGRLHAVSKETQEVNEIISNSKC